MSTTEPTIPSYEELHDALTVPQASECTRRSSFLLRADIRTGKLPAYKVGGRWKILPTDLAEYLDALVAPAGCMR